MTKEQTILNSKGWLRKTLEILRRVQDKLAQVPSLGWAIGYLLIIFVFAGLYTITSSGFYHSTSQFEKSLDDDAQEILNSLESILTSDTNFSSKRYDGWTLVKERYSVHSLKVFDENIGFSVNTVFQKDQDMVGMNVELYIALNEKHITCDYEQHCYSNRVIQTVKPIVDRENNFVSFIPQVLAYYGNMDVIKVPIELEEKFSGFVAARNGFPSEASGGFGRMLYLSVVTITTLGYGDIVPITDFNRLLIGLESIFGIVIIGLFLNSLTRERREQL